MNKHEKRKFFFTAERNINNALQLWVKKREDVEEFIDYYMKMIRLELGTASRTRFLGHEADSFAFGLLLPEEMLIEEETFISKTMDMETISYQWNSNRVIQYYLKRKYGKKGMFDEMALYYKELDVLEVVNGTHTASAIINSGETMEITATVAPLKRLLHEYETDGAFWIKNGRETVVHNPKVALLWVLARYKNNLTDDNWQNPIQFCDRKYFDRYSREEANESLCNTYSDSDIELWKDERIKKPWKDRFILRMLDILQKKLS